MIQKESILAAYPLADEYAQKGKVLGAKPNTIISELLRLSSAELINHNRVAVDPVGDVTSQDIEWYAQTVEDVTSGTIEQPTEHSKFLDSVINDISKAVLAHISFTKNVVKPVVVDYHESMEAAMCQFGSIEPSQSFNIENLYIPEILSEDRFTSVLDYYVGKIPAKPTVFPSMAAKGIEDIYQLLFVGEQSSDEAILAWRSRLNDAFFLKVWDNFFIDRKNSTSTFGLVRYDDLLGMNVFEQADYALAIYLIACKLFEQTDDTVAKLNLPAYQETIAQTRDFAGAMLTNVLLKARAFQANEIIVVSIDQMRKTCRVNGLLFQKWLNEGGSIETLYGLVVSGRQVYSRSLLNENKETFDKAWTNYTVFTKASQGNKEFEFFKELLASKFKELYVNLSEEETDYANKNPQYAENVIKYFNEEMTMLRSTDMADIFGTCLKLICRSRFYYTDSEKILLDIIEASKINPNVDVREAALLASVNYLVDYLADQLTLDSFN